MGIVFEWDAKKATANAAKHGVMFEEATTAFADPLSVTILDIEHSSKQEQRFVLLGQSRRGQLLVVAHTDDGHTIRIISARPATRHERKTYEEE